MKARVLFPFVLFAAACSAVDDSASSESDLTISPAGPGGDITVTIVVPREVLLQDLAFKFESGSSTLTPNETRRVAYEPGPDGKQTVTLSYSNSATTWTSAQKFEVAAGGELRVELGAFQVVGDVPDRSLLAMDLSRYYPRRNLVRASSAHQYDDDWVIRAGAAVDDATAPLEGLVVPAFAGDYAWLTNVAEPTSFHVDAGRVTSVDQSLANPFASIELSVPSPVFPNVAVEHLSVSCTLKGVSTPNGAGHGRAEGTPAKVYPVFLKTPAVCGYTLNETYGEPLELNPLERKVVPVGRIDVDDVELTDEAPGTKVPGVWTLRRGTKVLVDRQATKMGITLPFGTYHLIVDYVGLQGTSRRLEQDVDLR